jgi:hypothetical protein
MEKYRRERAVLYLFLAGNPFGAPRVDLVGLHQLKPI